MRKLILFLYLIVCPIIFIGQTSLKHSNWVNDYADILSDSDESALNSKISSFEKSTDIEIAVAVVSSLEQRDIESFSNELFNTWKIGKGDRNNGLLVVIAPNERQWRIEIGYGLEPYYTDYKSSEFASSNFIPNFKVGKYYDGINGFLDASMSYIGNKSWEDRLAYKQAMDAKLKEESDRVSRTVTIVLVSIILILAAIFIFLLLKRRRELAKLLMELKGLKVNLYRQFIVDTNNRLDSNGLDRVELLDENIKLINSSKSINVIELNYNTVISRYSDSINMLNLIDSIKLRISKVESNNRFINSFESKVGLLNSKFDSIKFDAKLGMDHLNSISYKLDSILKDNDSKIYKINKYSQMMSFALPNDFFNQDSKFSGKKYFLDSVLVSNLKDKFSKEYLYFNSLDKSYSNYSTLSLSFSKIESIISDFQNYVKSIVDKNIEHEDLLAKLEKFNLNKIDYNSELNRYLNKSGVKSSTKDSIRSLLLKISAFAISDDIMSSLSKANSITLEYNSLISKCKSDISDSQITTSSSSSGYKTTFGGLGGGRTSGGGFGGFGGGGSGGAGSSGRW